MHIQANDLNIALMKGTNITKQENPRAFFWFVVRRLTSVFPARH
jgi:hypothetical protein